MEQAIQDFQVGERGGRGERAGLKKLVVRSIWAEICGHDIHVYVRLYRLYSETVILHIYVILHYITLHYITLHCCLYGYVYIIYMIYVYGWYGCILYIYWECSNGSPRHCLRKIRDRSVEVRFWSIEEARSTLKDGFESWLRLSQVSFWMWYCSYFGSWVTIVTLQYTTICTYIAMPKSPFPLGTRSLFNGGTSLPSWSMTPEN